MKNIKPVYLYIISGIFSGISTTVEKNTPLYYTTLVLGVSFFIWAVAKHFRKSN
ncbi:hypothetical protein [Flavobacterium terrisoli]|uniref:hypothetical protein n=1 Tax=Flavobacterium terrisoli TaxID=3242195 RepID=UPI002542A971|nr:hypothetical protein [Flavobacterium buctense]